MKMKTTFTQRLLLTALLAIAALASPAFAAGVTYATLMGRALPSPLSLAFRAYEEELLARRCAEVPSARGTTYFISRTTRAGGSAPNNSNDGRDGIGFNLTTSVSYTASTRTLTKTNGFTSYVWQPNDLIYIKTATGISTGLYKITARTDASNIVFAAAADAFEGSAAAPTTDGTSITTSNGPFTTIAKAQTFMATTDVRVRFACGQPSNNDRGWLETTGLTITADHITVDSYGNGERPHFNAFATAVSTWAQDGATNRWTATCRPARSGSA
jgi:hypothetical protein